MRPIGDIEHDLDCNSKNLEPLLRDKTRLTIELKSAKAEEFIRVNNITIDDILLSDDEWYGNVWKFSESSVMRSSTKRFAEWNTIIYFRSDLISGKMPDMPATINDL